MFGVKIEDGRESRDEGARLAQILTVSKEIRKNLGQPKRAESRRGDWTDW